MKFGLDDKVIESIQQVFESNSRVDEVIIFGSRAKGNYREGSDIDLAVKGRGVSLQDILTLHSKLDDINLPYEIDLIDYAVIKDEEVIEHIDRVGIKFYERWKKYKWGDIATLEYGKGLNNYRHIKGDYPVYGTNGKIGTTDKFLCPIPGIIIGRKGAYRGVHYSSTPFYVIDTAFFLKPKIDDVDIKFAYYQLLTKDIDSMDSGSAIPSTSREDFYALEIDLPPLKEQINISKLLTELDDKIDLLQRQNKTLEQLAETLFRQWFVEEASEDWEEKKLAELLTVTSSKRIFYEEYVTSGVPFYRSKEIIELRNTGSIDSELFIRTERFNEIDKKFGSPKLGDILMTSVGTLGIPYRVRKGDKFYFKDGNLTWFRDFKGISSSIIYLWLISKIGQEELANITIGSTQEALTIEGLKSLSFKLPPAEKIKFYEQEFSMIINKIENNQKQILILNKLRDALLPKLMSGAVRVQLS